MRRFGAALGLTVALALALAFAQLANADVIDQTWVVGDEPLSMAVDPTDGRIFVGRSQGGFDRLVAIDPATNQVSTYVTSGTPNYLAIDPTHRRLYVSHHERLVDVFDLTTMTIEATLPFVGGTGIAVDPATRRVYIAGLDQFWVIDGATNTVVMSRPALQYETWMAVAIDPALHHVYVTNINEVRDGASILVHRSLVILDDRDLSLVAEVPTDRYVRWGLAADQTRHRVYLADFNASTSATLAVVDGTSRTLVDSVTLPGFVGGIALGPDTLYVTAINTGYHVLDPDTLDVRRSVTTTPFRPLLPILHPDGRLYLGGRDFSGPDVVAEIDLSNHAPMISATAFDPADPTTTDTLTLSVTAADGDLPDGSSLASTYAWARNGVLISGETGSTLDLARSGNGDRGDTVTAYVTVRDSEGLAASATASVVVVNSPPEPSVRLSNEFPHTNDALIASASVIDADGDQFNITYEWTRNGAVIPGATTSSLDLATHGDDGDVVAVRITVSDGHGGARVARASAVVVPNSGNFLAVRSDPGDYVGAGIEVLYTSVNSGFYPAELLQGGDYFRASVVQGTRTWTVDVAAPVGQPLAVGSYSGATWAPSQQRTETPGIAVTADARQCTTLTGRFEVHEVAFSIYRELVTFDATFEQRCAGATPGLVGRIRVEVPVQTPGVTLPSGAIAVPTSGSFLYFNGEPGGYIYPAERLFTSPPATMTSSMSLLGDYFRGRLMPDFWSVDIAAPAGQPLTVGSYIRAERASFRPPGSPGIDVSGDGRGCSGTTGKFDVDELTYADNGQILVFQATFEMHCESRFSPALYGRIRIENPVPGPLALPSGAITVPTSGTFLYVNSQPGDYVGAGAEYLYTSPASSILGELSTERDYFTLVVGSSLSSYLWRVDLASPPSMPLAAGAYARAVKAGFRPAGSPGLDVLGEGRGCFGVTGRFNIDELSFWANGDVRVFQATFEQHCDGAVPGLFGRLRFEGLPPVTLSVSLREEGSVRSGVVTISGTVSCSRNVAVGVSGTLSQPVPKRPTITGTFALSVDCVAPKTAWSATLVGDNGQFGAGQATAAVTTSVCEPNCVTATATRGVKLNSGK